MSQVAKTHLLIAGVTALKEAVAVQTSLKADVVLGSTLPYLESDTGRFLQSKAGIKVPNGICPQKIPPSIRYLA
jgi:hypothetical protein